MAIALTSLFAWSLEFHETQHDRQLRQVPPSLISGDVLTIPNRELKNTGSSARARAWNEYGSWEWAPNGGELLAQVTSGTPLCCHGAPLCWAAPRRTAGGSQHRARACAIPGPRTRSAARPRSSASRQPAPLARRSRPLRPDSLRRARLPRSDPQTGGFKPGKSKTPVEAPAPGAVVEVGSG